MCGVDNEPEPVKHGRSEKATEFQGLPLSQGSDGENKRPRDRAWDRRQNDPRTLLRLGRPDFQVSGPRAAGVGARLGRDGRSLCSAETGMSVNQPDEEAELGGL